MLIRSKKEYLLALCRKRAGSAAALPTNLRASRTEQFGQKKTRVASGRTLHTWETCLPCSPALRRPVCNFDGANLPLTISGFLCVCLHVVGHLATLNTERSVFARHLLPPVFRLRSQFQALLAIPYGKIGDSAALVDLLGLVI